MNVSRTYAFHLVVSLKIVNAISCDNRKEVLLQVYYVAGSFSYGGTVMQYFQVFIVLYVCG